MANALLKAVGLCKSYGAVEASKNLELEVISGEIHALIGPNGAGKTTALNQLSGELKPDAGAIFFNGEDITAMPVYKRAKMGLARSYQVTSIFEHLTVRSNISLAIQAHLGHSFKFWKNASIDPELCRRVAPALMRVGLKHRADHIAGNLSHGEKRQLEVGMALAGNPKMLLLDEPYAGMGPGGTVELSKMIQKLKHDVTILLVEHDMNVVFSMADRITVLVYGRAVATGTPDQIRSNTTVRQAYLGEEEC